jgi:hypothetical protein
LLNRPRKPVDHQTVTWRRVLWAIRIAFATLFALVAVKLFVMGWGIPLEGGAILFTPMLFVVGFFSLWLAVGCLVPRALRGGASVGLLLGDFFSI